MRNFWKGIILGFIGLVVWFPFTFIESLGGILVGEGANETYLLKYLGLIAMVGGPIFFWIVVPLRDGFGRRI